MFCFIQEDKRRRAEGKSHLCRLIAPQMTFDFILKQMCFSFQVVMVFQRKSNGCNDDGLDGGLNDWPTTTTDGQSTTTEWRQIEEADKEGRRSKYEWTKSKGTITKSSRPLRSILTACTTKTTKTTNIPHSTRMNDRLWPGWMSGIQRASKGS